MKLHTALSGLALACALVLVPGTPAQTAAPSAPTGTPLTAYKAPPFGKDCTVHRFGEGEVPKLEELPDDPLCVEYAKRDITLSNGGAIRFTLAEPARFALAGQKCKYWQRDHWSVQVAPGQVPIVRWDGSYWWDFKTGMVAARLSGMKVLGQPVTIKEGAKYVEKLSPALAAFFRQYGRNGDGGLLTAGVPLNPLCA